jgi:hypothetical protein
MPGMNAGEQLGQGLPLDSRQEWKDSVKVRLILWPHVLGLEQQDPFGREVRDAVRRVPDDVAVREPDGRVAPADPDVAVVRFAEHVKQVLASGRIAQPGLVRQGQLGWVASAQIRPLPAASKA